MREAMRERWARARAKQYEDWWCIVIGGPIGNLLAAVIAPCRHFTADLATLLSGALRLAGAALVFDGSRGLDLLAAALLQLGCLLDVIDGALARLRGPTNRGAFLDKAIDMVCLAAVFGAAGWRAASEAHDPLLLLAGAFVAWSVLLRGYLLWVVRAQELVAGGPPAIQAAPAPSASRTLWSRPALRIFFVGESDLYFWLSLGLVARRVPAVLTALASALAVWLVVIGWHRYRASVRLDGAAR
jgi:phosphatidylglycerophosphate synthase